MSGGPGSKDRGAGEVRADWTIGRKRGRDQNLYLDPAQVLLVIVWMYKMYSRVSS